MKKIISILFISCSLLSTSVIKSQEIDMQWVKQVSSQSNLMVRSVLSTSDGSVYTTGSYRGNTDFDPGVGSTVLTAFGNSEAFVQKLDANGNLEWVKPMVNSSIGSVSLGRDLVVDEDGFLYVAGTYRGPIQINEATGIVELLPIGNGDGFIQKISPDGTLIWIKRVGGLGTDQILGIDIDSNGDIIVGGSFRSTADFDPSSNIVNLTCESNNDSFILKLNSDGEFIWVKHFKSTNTAIINDVEVGPDNTIYTMGFFRDSLDLNPGLDTNLFIGDNTNTNTFILKLDSLGSYIWGRQFQSIGNSGIIGKRISVNEVGDIVTVGDFHNTIDFDPGVDSLIFTDYGVHDAFIHKLDINGDLLWARVFGGSMPDRATSVQMDDNGDVFVAGSFSLTVDFNFGVDTFELTSEAEEDMFLLKVDNLGDFEWVNQIEGDGQDFAHDIHRSENGNIYMVGTFENTADFDPSLDEFNLTSMANIDLFVEKFTECSLEGIDYIQSCHSYTWIDGETYTEDNDSSTYVLVNSQGCDSVVTLNLTINQVSNTNLSLNGTEISTNNPLASYVWLDCKNNFAVIPGETNPTFTGIPSGSYAVQFTENGCVDTSACITIDPLSIVESNLEGEWRLSPNPSKGHFTIKGSQIEAELSIKVFNVVGQEVYFKTVENTDEVHINLNVESGLYLVKVVDGKGNSSHFQLVKE